MTGTITQEIPQVGWAAQLREWSEQYRGWRASIEVMGGELGNQRVAEDLPLQGFSAETKGSEAGKILIELGDTPEDFMIHHVDHPLRMRVVDAQPGAETDVQIESESGMTTLVRLRAPTALPPGAREEEGGRLRRRFRPEHKRTNVGEGERIASVAAGSLLAAVGISRRSIPGALVAGLGGALIHRGVTGYCRAYSALGVDTAHQKADRRPDEIWRKGVHVEEACLINKSPEELYNYWRNFENLPRIMSHLETVRVLDDRRSHWVAKAPRVAGGRIEWDAEITHDEPNALIGWRSLPGSEVENVGQIRFSRARGDRGTEVHVFMDYIPPAGRLGHWVATLFGESPQRQMREDLRSFKRLMETGEILTTEGQPRGTCSGRGYGEEEAE